MTIVEELHAQGVARYTTAPPLYRLAWRLGLEIPPPLYQPFKTLAVNFGIYFGVTWGVFMGCFIWLSKGPSIASFIALVLGSILAGLWFGVFMGAYYRRKAKKLRLPPLDGSTNLIRTTP